MEVSLSKIGLLLVWIIKLIWIDMKVEFITREGISVVEKIPNLYLLFIYMMYFLYYPEIALQILAFRSWLI